MKSHEIRRLHTQRQSNVLLFKALDRLVEAGWQQSNLTKFVESGLLLARESWDTMDTYRMGPKMKKFPLTQGPSSLNIRVCNIWSLIPSAPR